MKKYKINDVVKCRVTGVEKYGIFVKIDEKYDGLIHISEITYNFVRDINDYSKVDDIIFCKIIEIDEINYKMKLSIKDVDYKQSGEIKQREMKENGFNSLKTMLPEWVCCKLEEYKEDQIKND